MTAADGPTRHWLCELRSHPEPVSSSAKWVISPGVVTTHGANELPQANLMARQSCISSQRL